jgi:hypothetical protein
MAERKTMKMLNAMLTTLFITMAVHGAISQTPALKPWSAATYHGLTVGTSTRADVLKFLGKPYSISREEEGATGAPVMNYEVTDPVKGTLSIFIKKGILDGISISPKKSLTNGDIIRIFGPDYVVVHYASDDCIDYGGTSPLYQNPRGPFKRMEYRELGIAAAFAYNDDEKVEAIIFTYKAFGPSHSICAARAKKK